MPANVTLAELRTRVRDLADMQTSNQASAFVTDAELDRTINRACKQLHGKLIIAHGDDYFAVSTSGNFAGNISLFFIADFMQLVAFTATDGTRVVDVPKYTMKDIGRLQQLANTGGAPDLSQLRYRLQGSALPGGIISVLPLCSNPAYIWTVHYIKTFTPLVLPGDSFDGINGWEDWACYTSAIDLLIKEESLEQAQVLTGQRAVIDSQIDALAGSRDAGRPDVVGDTMQDFPSTQWSAGTGWGY